MTFVERERLTRVALFGVRFWDRATGRSVSEGLRLVHVGSRRSATPNGSGVFVVTDMPGLLGSAYGSGDEDYWQSPPARRTVGFELVDDVGRFHSVRFDATVPFRDVFEEDCGFTGSPPDEVPPSVPLFSLPSRPVPAGSAAIRAELTDAATGDPAARAVVEVTAPGAASPARGIADRMGRVVVLLPYPEPPWQSTSPPPGSHPLSEQTWAVEVAVRYSPGAAVPPLPRRGNAELPDLCTVLTQLPATLAADASPPVPVVGAELVFGRDLFLNDGARRTLLVTPAS